MTWDAILSVLALRFIYAGGMDLWAQSRVVTK